MRTWTICSECVAINPADAKVMVEIDDALLFEITCRRGHKFIGTLEATRFSLLYDFGLAAFLDGYYREATGNFAVAMERLHEFAIRVICRKNGASFKAVDEAWRDVSSQSERQLGAFCFLYLQEAKVRFELLDNRWVNFRNKVIHKGYFPTRSETLDYAEAVHDCMMKVLRFIANGYQQYSDAVWIEERSLRGSRSPLLQSTSHGAANFIPRSPGEDVRWEKSFAEKFEIFSKLNPWIFK